MPATDETDALYRVAYDEAVRALAEQQALIESLRARAGLLLSAAAIATSFLGSQALGADTTALAWLALFCFFAVAVTMLAILWPRESMAGVDAQRLIRDYAETPSPIPVKQLHRNLALFVQSRLWRSQHLSNLLAVLLQLGSFLFAVEMLLWVAALVFGP